MYCSMVSKVVREIGAVEREVFRYFKIQEKMLTEVDFASILIVRTLATAILSVIMPGTTILSVKTPGTTIPCTSTVPVLSFLWLTFRLALWHVVCHHAFQYSYHYYRYHGHDLLNVAPLGHHVFLPILYPGQ